MNTTADPHPMCHEEGPACVGGLILPALYDSEDAAEHGRWYWFAFAIGHALALAYMLYGVNIMTERLISTIQVIISVKKQVKKISPNGDVTITDVPVWHPVVATLTVFIVGASAPEVFLPTIEIIKHGFESDELGPAVVVGSGAYHLFLVTGVCLASVKDGVSKHVEDLPLFFVSMAFAITAYLWLFLLVEYISPGVIELWEAIVTLSLFPTIVIVAWAVEKRMVIRGWRKIRKKWTVHRVGKQDDEAEQTSESEHLNVAITEQGPSSMVEHERRRRLGKYLKEIRSQNPDMGKLELEELAELKMLESAPKNAAFYRIQTSKASSGGGAVFTKEKIKQRLLLDHDTKTPLHLELSEPADSHQQTVGFSEVNHTCIESCGDYLLTVERYGVGVERTRLEVDFETQDGASKAGSDYEEKRGTIVLEPGQGSFDLPITIIDDDEFEEDKEFFVVLHNPRITTYQGHGDESVKSHLLPFTRSTNHSPINVVLAIPKATILILDDDHCGHFHFENEERAIPDNIGTAHVKIVRSTGARGRVQVPYRVTPGTAKPIVDYRVPAEGAVTFEDNQAEAAINIDIIDSDRIGEVHTFFAELYDPILLSRPPANPDGNPDLGSPKRIKLGICEDEELSEALDRLLKIGDIADLISATTWAEQFREAVAMPFVKERDFRDNLKKAGLRDCFQHLKMLYLWALALPWKLFAAIIPPARYLDGWLAFVLLLAVMASVAAVIGDLANHFGCLCGVKQSVTAATLVAFGMGLPDLFASRHAAVHESTADSAIGHITGSNAVNVFLGIGMSWTVGASVKTYRGSTYEVPMNNFPFMVVVYCAFASIAIVILLIRRLPPIRGELGGPKIPKIISSLFFILLWVAFIVLVTLHSYCIIPDISREVISSWL